MVVRVYNELDYNGVLTTLRDDYGLTREYYRMRNFYSNFMNIKGIRLIFNDDIQVFGCYTVPPDSISAAAFYYLKPEDVIQQMIFDSKL